VWVVVIVVAVGSMFGAANNLQQAGHFTRPPTIRYSVSDASLFVDHAMAVKLQLLFPSSKQHPQESGELHNDGKVLHPLYLLSTSSTTTDAVWCGSRCHTIQLAIALSALSSL
jgi:hypothetical protein